jgi:hypothetical protein
LVFKDLSANNLIGLSGSVAISIAKNLDSEEISLLSSFFSSLGDNLALISIQKSKEEQS